MDPLTVPENERQKVLSNDSYQVATGLGTWENTQLADWLLEGIND